MHQEVGAEEFWELPEEAKTPGDILRTTGIDDCSIAEVSYGILPLHRGTATLWLL